MKAKLYTFILVTSLLNSTSWAAPNKKVSQKPAKVNSTQELNADSKKLLNSLLLSKDEIKKSPALLDSVASNTPVLTALFKKYPDLGKDYLIYRITKSDKNSVDQTVLAFQQQFIKENNALKAQLTKSQQQINETISKMKLQADKREIKPEPTKLPEVAITPVAPTPAPSIVTSNEISSQKVAPKQEMSLADLQRLIPGFTAAKVGSDPNSKAQLYGRIPTACLNDTAKFSVNVIKKSNSEVGLNVISEGFKECLEQWSAEKKTCNPDPSSSMYCIPISKTDSISKAFTLDMAALGDVKIGIVTHDPNRDLDAIIFEPLKDVSGKEIAHRSFGSISLEAQNTKKEEDKKAKADFKAEFAECIKKSEIEKAETLFENIKPILETSETTEFENKLAEAKFNQLIKAEDSEALKAWAELRCDNEDNKKKTLDADKVALIFIDIARAKIDSNPGVKGIQLADSIITDAQTISCLSPELRSKMSQQQKDLGVALVKAHAERGLNGNMAFSAAYDKLFNSAEKERVEACTSTASSSNPLASLQTQSANVDPEKCDAATKRVQEIAKLPSIAQQAEQKKYCDSLLAVGQFCPSTNSPNRNSLQAGGMNPFMNQAAAPYNAFASPNTMPQMFNNYGNPYAGMSMNNSMNPYMTAGPNGPQFVQPNAIVGPNQFMTPVGNRQMMNSGTISPHFQNIIPNRGAVRAIRF